MARLYDLLVAGQTLPPVWTDRGFDAATLRKLRGAPVFVTDNVSDYYYETSPQDDWRLAQGDFPNLAPPFPAFWMETRFGGWINRGGKLERIQKTARATGVLVLSEKTQTGWKVSFNMVVDWGTKRLPPSGPYGSVIMTIDEYGRYVDDGPFLPDGQRGVLCGVLDEDRLRKHPTLGREAEGILEDLAGSLVDNVKPFCLALSFMHCRNVERSEVEQPPKLSRKWQKKHGRPLVRYHVLDIDPMRKVLRDEGGSEETGLKKALHICRGHFAHYPDGLFGRGVAETVWRPQHVRGSAKEGLVLKDYNVKAPK